ncbi:MAG: response regulator [Nitrospinae bacterium]|nr:response regulator [Nitrospinota bacterium]
MKKILVIDDEVKIAEGLAKMLSSWGYDAKSVTSGLKGIDCLRSGQFNLVITDLRMPDIGGIELLKRIKASAPEIKIIVLSGSLGEINIPELSQLDIFRLLEKPVSKKDIRTAVEEALGMPQAKTEIKTDLKTTEIGREAIVRDKHKSSFSKGNVLVVDDEEELAKMIKNVLTLKNYNVTTASDGMMAVEKIQSQRFDLILMDIRMPNMDGIEAVKKIKEINPDSFIVMMTGMADDEEIEKAIEEGGYAVLRKPFSPDGLLKSISWFRNAEENIKFKKEQREAMKNIGAWDKFKLRAGKKMENYRMNILTVSLITISIVIGISLVFFMENLRVSLTRYYSKVSSSYTDYMDKVIGYLDRDEQRELKGK